jgi:hypothetical protein
MKIEQQQRLREELAAARERARLAYRRWQDSIVDTLRAWQLLQAAQLDLRETQYEGPYTVSFVLRTQAYDDSAWAAEEKAAAARKAAQAALLDVQRVLDELVALESAG